MPRHEALLHSTTHNAAAAALLCDRYRHASWQLHQAATQIAKVLRGYVVRSRGWRFGGVLSHAAALKVQRTFRGWVGRERARALYEAYQGTKQMVLAGAWRCYYARRMLRLLRAIDSNVKATQIQKSWRGRCVRKMIRAMRLAIRIRQATKIQKTFRLSRGILRSRMVKTGLVAAITRRANFYRDDIMATFSGKTQQLFEQDWSVMSAHELAEYALLLACVSRKTELAAHATAYLVATHPSFAVGRLVRCLVLMKLWTSVTKIGYLGEDFLQEVFYLLSGDGLDRRAQHMHVFECTTLRAFLNVDAADGSSMDLHLLHVLKIAMRVNWGADWMGFHAGNFKKVLPDYVPPTDPDAPAAFSGLGHVTSKSWRVGPRERSAAARKALDAIQALKVSALKNIKRDYAAQTENISIGKIDSLCSGSEDSAMVLLKQDADGDYGGDDDDDDNDGGGASALMAPTALAADAFAIDLDSAHFRALRTVNLQLEIVENVFCKSRNTLLAKVRYVCYVCYILSPIKGMPHPALTPLSLLPPRQGTGRQSWGGCVAVALENRRPRAPTQALDPRVFPGGTRG